MDWDDDDWEISDADFAAAKKEVLEHYGEIPLSLQRIIDMGGRFGRGIICTRESHDDACCYPGVPCTGSAPD